MVTLNNKYKIGDIVGNFTVIDLVRVESKIKLNVKCKCGNIINIEKFRIEKTKSCKKCRNGNYPGKIISGCMLLEKISPQKWKMRCRCGNEYINQVRFDKNIFGEKFRDCGCTKNLSYKTRAEDKIGMKFGKLKVINVKDGEKHKLLVCKCRCGNVIEFHNGHECKQNSCGCLKKENQPKADRHIRAKMKNSEVLSMREFYESKSYDINQLAEMHGLTPNYVWRIVHRKIWKSI